MSGASSRSTRSRSVRAFPAISTRSTSRMGRSSSRAIRCSTSTAVRFERTAVDVEQRIALLDDLPILEVDLVEIAGNARTDLDRVDRDEAPDILVVVGYWLFGRLGDGDRWR